MTEHLQLSKAYLYLAKNSSDAVISLSFLLKSIEELALEKMQNNSYSSDTTNKMMEYIRNSPSLYKEYRKILNEMTNYLLNGNSNVKELIDNVEKYILTITNN
ncbi:hypothetical protein [Acidianus manzaensis]|uniref:HEPN domain-containing protein n=1 Tax=Acidianus manzaensis TaxID=282676 RepID=A0A1W6JYJ7_9CREN|nr:hypothetical protein [Acidianus manzaensis]ARM75346.1 hypothetical protein B6F84_04405 [Acidianus manzaensis]